MTLASPVSQNAVPLPKLRPELELVLEAGGGMVYDPVSHRYSRIDGASAAIFLAWRRHGNAADMLTEAATMTGGALTAVHVTQLQDFARRNGWLLPATEAEVQALTETAIKREKRDWRWWLHNYISFRLPLISPEPVLDRMAPVLIVVFSRAAMILTAVVGIVALYLASRQWTELSAAAHGLMSPSAIALLGATLLVVKVWHEIGHGHFARRYGCRVPSAGVMMILGAPLFYTDVTDAWRLLDRRKRMVIAAGGVMAEAMLAVLALTAWVFLPDGALRSLCFFVATGSLITSLLVNLSPFMRFDGYFLLSDALKVPNLHAKAFAAMMWLLRRTLLGFADPRPREINGMNVGLLALFGAGTALYRFGLFFGLALLVYHMTFKILGVFLFAIEILWFIAKPISRELAVWRERRSDIRWRRHGLVSMVVVAVIALLLIAPLSQHVRMKAVIGAGQLARLHASVPANVSSVHKRPGEIVSQGDAIVTLSSPQLTHQLSLAETRLALVNARLARSSGDAQERALIQVLLSEKASLEVQRAGVLAEMDALVLRAPFDGRIMEFDREVRPGVVVSPKQRIALVSGQQGLSARAYASAEAAHRLKAPARAWFVPEDATAGRIPLTLALVGAAATQVVEPPSLADGYGGDVPVAADRSGKPTASAAAFLLTFAGEGHPPALAIRGSVHVEASPESFAARFARRAASIIIRESGV